MLNRDQQGLLGAIGAGMAADALLGHLPNQGTIEGGRSAPQPGCWINYNRKAVWLEDHSQFNAALRVSGYTSATATAADAADSWRRIRPQVIVKVTWAKAAAYGATLPSELRTELSTLRDADRNENRSWWEFSTERGGWPWRRRFESDEEHVSAKTEWDTRYHQHLVTLNDLWGRQKAAVARALPLTVDDEPVDLLELLDQQSASPLDVAPPRVSSTVLQTAALQPPAAAGERPRPEDAIRTTTQPNHRAGPRR